MTAKNPDKKFSSHKTVKAILNKTENLNKDRVIWRCNGECVRIVHPKIAGFTFEEVEIYLVGTEFPGDTNPKDHLPQFGNLEHQGSVSKERTDFLQKMFCLNGKVVEWASRWSGNRFIRILGDDVVVEIYQTHECYLETCK